MDEAEAKRARRLPPGPHGLPPELVERNQRERLIAAMAEVCGERGYAESSVAEIAKRAGVSTASFYRQFADKRECMLASFEQLFGRLIAAIERGCAGEEPSGASPVQRGAEVAIGLLADDQPTARLLSVEILALGPDGIRAQHQAIERLAALLRRGSGSREPSPDAAWVAVAASTAWLAKTLAEGARPSLGEIQALLEEA